MTEQSSSSQEQRAKLQKDLKDLDQKLKSLERRYHKRAQGLAAFEGHSDLAKAMARELERMGRELKLLELREESLQTELSQLPEPQQICPTCGATCNEEVCECSWDCLTTQIHEDRKRHGI